MQPLAAARSNRGEAKDSETALTERNAPCSATNWKAKVHQPYMNIWLHDVDASNACARACRLRQGNHGIRSGAAKPRAFKQMR